MTPDAALSRAGDATGPRTLALPSRAHPTWRAEFSDGRAMQVDDATGAVTPAAPPLGGDVAFRWLHRLHGGTDLPLIWRLVLTLTGLAPALLGITGVSIWMSRLSRRRRAAAD